MPLLDQERSGSTLGSAPRNVLRFGMDIEANHPGRRGLVFKADPELQRTTR